ncbi:MAG: hypothetical protein WB559_16240 [Candidatus Acidiferrales bacterium]
MPEAAPGPQIVEAYKNYTPPFNAAKTVRRLLRYVPPKYLVGLKTVVLTNQQAMSRDQRRRKLWSRRRKVPMDRVRGTYCAAWKGNPAWIQLFVDKIITTDDLVSRIVVRIPLAASVALGEVLYHEIGHHVHKTQRPEYREREDVADDWGRRMSRTFLRARYWYLVPVLKLIAGIYRLTGKSGPAGNTRATTKNA